MHEGRTTTASQAICNSCDYTCFLFWHSWKCGKIGHLSQDCTVKGMEDALLLTRRMYCWYSLSLSLCFMSDAKYGDPAKVHISQELQGYYAQWVLSMIAFETFAYLILYCCFTTSIIGLATYMYMLTTQGHLPLCAWVVNACSFLLTCQILLLHVPSKFPLVNKRCFLHF